MDLSLTINHLQKLYSPQNIRSQIYHSVYKSVLAVKCCSPLSSVSSNNPQHNTLKSAVERVRFILTVWLLYPILFICSAGNVQSSCYCSLLLSVSKTHLLFGIFVWHLRGSQCTGQCHFVLTLHISHKSHCTFSYKVTQFVAKNKQYRTTPLNKSCHTRRTANY